MSLSCAAKSCIAHEQDKESLDLNFYPFPEDEETCREWIKRCGRYDLLQKPIPDVHCSEYLCERHFDEQCFEENSNVLKGKATPTLFDHYVEDVTGSLTVQKTGNGSGGEIVVIPCVIMENVVNEEEVIEYGEDIKEETEEEMNEMDAQYEIGEEMYIQQTKENGDGDEQGEFQIITGDTYDEQDNSHDGERINIVSHIGNHLQSEEEAAKQEVVSIVLDEAYDGEGWEQNMALANILCRICASSDGELIPLFGDKGIEMQLIEKIKWYLPIEVKHEDKLPLQMCSSCIDKLNTCHELMNCCVEADTKLRRMFNADDDDDTEHLRNMETYMKKDSEQTNHVYGNSKKLYSYGSTASEDADTHDADNQIELEDEDDDNSVFKDENQYGVTKVLSMNMGNRDGSRNNFQVKIAHEECDSDFKNKISGAIKEILVKEDTENTENDDSTIWQCEICHFQAFKKTILMNHVRRKHADEVYVCQYCNTYFGDEASKLEHEFEHTKMQDEENEQPVYVCEYCGKSFRGKRSLKEHHIAVHTDEKPFKCDECGKNYGSLASLDIHKSTHSTETPYLCDLCGKSFKHINNLRSHKRCHLDEPYKNRQLCSKCGKGFRSKFHLNEHMNVHNGIRPYSCDKCGKHFHKKIQLRQHGSAHLGAQPFKCHICGVKFNRRGNMTQHVKRHEQERKYTCKVCNETFPTLGAVLNHRKMHSDVEVERSIQMQVGDDEHCAYKCELCGKLLAKKESLITHMRSHTGEKLFECTVCGKKLSNKGSLTYHMRSFHTGERPHTCQFCGEGFLSKEARVVHERLHTGEKPYKCSVCGMAFRCSSNLSQHVKVHSEERPHPCQHCGKAFQRKGALDVHMRTHTGERPYTCDICGRGFTQKNDMLKHRRIHTQEKPYRCEHCGQLFPQKRDLTKHQQIHQSRVPQEVVHEVVEEDEEEEDESSTQTVVITTSENNIINFPEIPVNVPVMENAQTLILHRF